MSLYRRPIAVLFLLAPIAVGQAPAPKPTAPPASAMPASTAPALTPTAPAAPVAVPGDLIVDSAFCHKPHENAAASTAEKWKTQPCELGDTVKVLFKNLDDWVRADPQRHDPTHLVIALNGHPLAGTQPQVMVAGSNVLAFEMTAPEGTDAEANANKQAWRAILHAHRSPVQLMLSVGPKDGELFYGRIPLDFRLYPPYAPIVFILIALLILTVGWLAARSGLVRAPGPDPGPGRQRPFSLGRTQMAWWFVVVAASYLYIWLITQNQDSLTSGVLILIGISAATGLGSQVAGGGAAGGGAVAPAPAPPPGLAGEPPPVPAAAPPSPHVSRGFLTDILGDEDGISFDRLQMAAWTLILGLVFAVEVLTDLDMPDFSPMLLGLMGISSGTYVGFKLPGKSS